jgi:hypothetical protein
MISHKTKQETKSIRMYKYWETNHPEIKPEFKGVWCAMNIGSDYITRRYFDLDMICIPVFI